MAYRWLFARARHVVTTNRHRKLLAEMRRDASRRVASHRIASGRVALLSKETRDKLTCRPFGHNSVSTHRVIRDGITRARTRGHTCARDCGWNYSRCTGYNWRAMRESTWRGAGLNSKKCTRPARQQREIRARCFYDRWIRSYVVGLNPLAH